MAANNQQPDVSFVLIELTKGKASFGLRFSNKPGQVEILTKYKDMDPRAAARLMADVVHGLVSRTEIANEPYEVYPLPPDAKIRLETRDKN